MPLPQTSHENTMGPYRLLRSIGEGGMGSVFLAHDDALKRYLAIKVLRTDGQTSDRAAAAVAKRFLREAQSAAKINHPHVVTVYAVGTHAGRSYMAMEDIADGSLAQRLRSTGPLTWREAAAAMRDALRGLIAAHQAGVVHRDIKPANLMCGRDSAGAWMTKLADFGLARVTTLADAELTFPGAFVGSPSYSAPEQIVGSRQIDGRADLYALAATGYALLIGQPPFVADDPAEVMEQHLHQPFPEVAALAPGVPAAFQEMLSRAAEKRPEDRFGNARDMLEAVEKLLALPSDIAPAAVRRPKVVAGASSSAHESVVELETRLAEARRVADSSTQLDTLRTLYGLYSQLDRRQDAQRAYREALVLHVKIHAPGRN